MFEVESASVLGFWEPGEIGQVKEVGIEFLTLRSAFACTAAHPGNSSPRHAIVVVLCLLLQTICLGFLGGSFLCAFRHSFNSFSFSLVLLHILDLAAC